jgi:hypothetical protein
MALVPMTGRGQDEDRQPHTRVASLPLQNLDALSNVKVISLSESEFDQLFRQRSRATGIPERTEWTDLTREQQKLLPARFAFQSPTRQKLFSELTISIDLAKDDVLQIVSAFKLFPEITAVYAHYESLGNQGGIEWNEMPYERTPVPLPLVQALLDLPHLRVFVIRGGTWSTEAVVMLAKHPSLRVLGLGRSRISLDAFSKLSALKTLEEVSAIVGLEPRCFITLAKLPRLKGFDIGGATEEFNVPIDEATRRAIESLDGRLERFSAETMPTTVHADIFRALLKVKSLKSISIDTPDWQLTPADFEPLKGMTNLVHVNLPTGGGGRSRHDQEKIDAIINSVQLAAKQRKKEQEMHKERSRR